MMALWMYFWDSADWTPPAPPPPTTNEPLGGKVQKTLKILRLRKT